MNLREIIARQKKQFNKKFVGLKSVGHTKIHENNHSAHDGTKCTSKCKYVNEAILDWHSSSIKEILEGVVQIEKDKREKIIKNKEQIGNDPFHSARCQYLGQQDAKSDTINHLEQIINKLN